MKKLLLAGVLCLGAAAQAVMIDYIQIEQATGISAVYTSGDGQLEWSGGSFSYIATENGNFFTFGKSDVSFNFGLFSDDSVGGEAAARFDLLGTWSVALYENDWDTTPVVTVSGNLNSGGGFDGRYLEGERENTAAVLDGKAWVNITSYWADPTWYATYVLGAGYDGLEWDDMVAGLDSDVTLDGQVDLDDYGQDYTSTNGLTVTIWADQSQIVPEPATLVILALGGLMLKRKN